MPAFAGMTGMQLSIWQAKTPGYIDMARATKLRRNQVAKLCRHFAPRHNENNVWEDGNGISSLSGGTR